MNIIEAIKSGKKYRLHGTEGWFHPPVEHLQNSVFFSVQHILADDWEIEQTPVSITREQFDLAFSKVISSRLVKEYQVNLREEHRIL